MKSVAVCIGFDVMVDNKLVKSLWISLETISDFFTNSVEINPIAFSTNNIGVN